MPGLNNKVSATEQIGLLEELSVFVSICSQRSVCCALNPILNSDVLLLNLVLSLSLYRS